MFSNPVKLGREKLFPIEMDPPTEVKFPKLDNLPIGGYPNSKH